MLHVLTLGIIIVPTSLYCFLELSLSVRTLSENIAKVKLDHQFWHFNMCICSFFSNLHSSLSSHNTCIWMFKRNYYIYHISTYIVLVNGNIWYNTIIFLLQTICSISHSILQMLKRRSLIVHKLYIDLVHCTQIPT